MTKKDETLDAEIKALIVSADKYGMEAMALTERIGKSLRADLENPIDDVRNLSFLSRAFADLAAQILLAVKLQEQRNELRQLKP